MIKAIKFIFTTLGTAILGMLGGQKNVGGKGTRRFGIPGLALLMGKFKKNSLPFILLIPLLVMGYGENSILMKLLGHDALVRVAYGILLSLPFLFYGFKRWLFALISLCVAFSVRAGSMGTFFGMDLLIEDFIRYGTLGVLIAVNLFS